VPPECNFSLSFAAEIFQGLVTAREVKAVLFSALLLSFFSISVPLFTR